MKYSYLQIFGDIKQLSDCLGLEDLGRLREDWLRSMDFLLGRGQKYSQSVVGVVSP